jgi:acetylornithine deacetylase/succinyl-diaminopimelate desuccinylase-like protein
MGGIDPLEWATGELVKLIEIESFSGHEHAVVEHLERVLADLDLPTTTSAVAGCGPNLLVGWDPRPALLVTAHTDTITPTWEWNRSATVDGTIVRGLGAQDDKGCAVACLLALLIARDRGADLEHLPVGVGLCVDEELEGRGSRQMAAELRPAYVVASEGTELEVATAEAGYVDAWVDVTGRRAHHSFMEEGDNAVHRAAQVILACQQAPFLTARPAGLPNRIAVSAISSPPEINVVPSHARFFLEGRIFSPTEPEEAVAQLRQICTDGGAGFELVEAARWFDTDPQSPLVRLLSASVERATGARASIGSMPAWTDAHSFVELGGSDAVVFGPGHLRSAHGPDEHIDVREIVRAAEVLADLVAHAGELVG